MKKIAFLICLLAGCAATSSPTPRGPVGAFDGLTETLNLGATIRSTPFHAVQTITLGYALRFTGAPTGTVTVLYSNDYNPGVDSLTDDTKWDTYTLPSSPPALTGSPVNFGITLDSFEFAWARLKYTYSSGSGSAVVAVRSK